MNHHEIKRALARKSFRHFVGFTKPDYEFNWHHQRLCQKLQDFAEGKIKRLMVFMPPRHGKQCSASTPILTTQGWTTHGELKVGDFVFHPNGHPVKILAKSKPTPCNARVHFSDGSFVDCHMNHEWTVFDRRDHKWKTIETRDLKPKTNRCHQQVQNISPLWFEEKTLSIHPYVLGAWLGDGTNCAPAITHDSKDLKYIEKIESLGYKVTSRTIHKTTGCMTSRFGDDSTRTSTMTKHLQSAGVWKNKHIPTVFKTSSINQRLELLAGLIDTDGNTDKNGRVRIVTVSKVLANDIFDIASSLGFRPYITEQKPVLSSSGIQGKQIIYSVGFNPTMEIPVALVRKKTNRLIKQRMIGVVKVEPIQNGELGHCIQVDSDDGLYLVGKNLLPTHNSELTSRRFPAWLLGRNPKTKIIATSYASELASSFNRDVQRIIENPLFRELFPDVNLNGSNVRTTQSWLRNNDIFEIVNHGGYYRCAGVGGAITGLGGEFLIIDDPFKNYEEAKSPTIRKKVFEWYTSTLYTRQEKNAGILLIQTRWHEDDLAGMLLNLQKRGGEYADQWEVINFPAILENENEEDPRHAGEVLWPEKYNAHWMNVTKTSLGSFQFSALYQQNPTPDEGRVVQSHWIPHYRQLPSHFDEMIQSWDMSFGSLDENASYVVGSVYAQRGSQIFLVDQVRGQWGFNETIAQFEILTKRYPKAFRKLVEKKANGSAVIDVLKNKIQGIIPVEPEGSKESRLMSCQPLYEAGNVLYPDESIHPWVIDHKAELIGFPNAKHNDRVDAESQALNHFLLKGVGTFTDDMANLSSSGFGIGEW